MAARASIRPIAAMISDQSGCLMKQTESKTDAGRHGPTATPCYDLARVPGHGAAVALTRDDREHRRRT